MKPIKIMRTRNASSGGVVTDPNFAKVKLLMGFEGTNGSTAFVDESGSPHTMTANGNAQITTSQFKMGAGAAAFDGTGDFISSPDSNDWWISNNGGNAAKFTVELFARFLVKQTSQALIGQWDNAGAVGNCCWFFNITGSGSLQFTDVNSTSQQTLSAPFAPTLGQWYHLAADRDASNKMRIYVDGSMLISGTNPNTWNNSTNSLTIGRIGTGTTFSSSDFNGNMDEIRITAGVARYASDSGFTVPTAAFPRS